MHPSQNTLAFCLLLLPSCTHRWFTEFPIRYSDYSPTLTPGWFPGSLNDFAMPLQRQQRNPGSQVEQGWFVVFFYYIILKQYFLKYCLGNTMGAIAVHNLDCKCSCLCQVLGWWSDTSLQVLLHYFSFLYFHLVPCFRNT